MPSPSNLYFGYDVSKTRALRCGLRAFETKDHKWGYMDEKCQVVLQPQWDKVRDFSEGYAWTFKRNTSDGTHTATLIDKTGRLSVHDASYKPLPDSELPRAKLMPMLELMRKYFKTN